MRFALLLSSLMIVALAVGCTTAMYSGPKRPLSEVARIVCRDTQIRSVDGKKTRFGGHHGAKILVLPGAHELGVTLSQIGPGYHLRSDRPDKVWFHAEAGHIYRVIPRITPRSWRPVIIDRVTGQTVHYYEASEKTNASGISILTDPSGKK